MPGEALELTGSAPFDGPLTVKTGNGEHAIARELAVHRHRLTDEGGR